MKSKLETEYAIAANLKDAKEAAVYASRNAERGDIREMVMDFKAMRNSIYKIKYLLEEREDGKQ